MELFKNGRTYWLQIEVQDEKEAEKLMCWMYPERSKIKVDQFGCVLKTVSWEDPWEKYKKFIEPLKQAFMNGEL